MAVAAAVADTVEEAAPGCSRRSEVRNYRIAVVVKERAGTRYCRIEIVVVERRSRCTVAVVKVCRTLLAESVLSHIIHISSAGYSRSRRRVLLRWRVVAVLGRGWRALVVVVVLAWIVRHAR